MTASEEPAGLKQETMVDIAEMSRFSEIDRAQRSETRRLRSHLVSVSIPQLKPLFQQGE
jgi:hypothetical protein